MCVYTSICMEGVSLNCSMLFPNPTQGMNYLRQVCELQREFCTEMLRSSNFNKLLSAARECHKLLDRSKQLAQEDGGASLKVGVAPGFSNLCMLGAPR